MLVQVCISEEGRYASIPLEYTDDDVAEYRKRTKTALMKDAKNMLEQQSPEATWCDALDAVVRETGLDISTRYLEALDEEESDGKDYIDVYLAVAAQIPKFTDLLDEKQCSAITRGANADVITGLEGVARQSFEGFLVGTDHDPNRQFGMLKTAVKELAKTFSGVKPPKSGA